MSDIRGEPVPVTAGAGLSEDEKSELDRLRAEVALLRSQQAAAPRRHRIGWRAPVATLLIVLGCALTPVAVLGVWTANADFHAGHSGQRCCLAG
jgi:cytochrome c-type biogenesis protein CcmH/NrfG